MKRSWLWIGAALLALAFLYSPTLGIGRGQILAFLLLLLCPLLHFFGMRGHGSGESAGNEPAAPGSSEIKASKREEA
jgi:hypothetical protein